MKKVISFALVWLAVGWLVACGDDSAAPTATALLPSPSPSEQAQPSPIAAPSTAAGAAPTPVEVAAAMPSPTPAIPPVTAADWQIGPADAPVTFVEYSDFQ